MAWTVAPSSESTSEPSRPLAVMSKNKCSPPSDDQTAGNRAITAEPNRAAPVPNNEIPPEVPLSTRLPGSVIRRGGEGFNTPSSVAQVSALTAASAAANPRNGQG